MTRVDLNYLIEPYGRQKLGGQGEKLFHHAGAPQLVQMSSMMKVICSVVKFSMLHFFDLVSGSSLRRGTLHREETLTPHSEAFLPKVLPRRVLLSLTHREERYLTLLFLLELEDLANFT